MNYLAIGFLILIISWTCISVYLLEEQSKELKSSQITFGSTTKFWDWNTNMIVTIVFDKQTKFYIPSKDFFVLKNVYDKNEIRYLNDLSICKNQECRIR